MAFNYKALDELKTVLQKKAFVPIDAKSAQDAGAMPPPGGDPAAMAGGAPMPPPGGDPAAMAGAPMGDPAMMQDPSMMAGGAPMGGGDPMMGMPPPDGGQQMSPDGEPLMTANQWMSMAKKMNSFIQSITNGGQAQQQQAQDMGTPSPEQLAALNAKMDAVLPAIMGNGGDIG